MDKLPVIKQLLDTATAAIQTKRRLMEPRLRRTTIRAIHAIHTEATEKDLRAALAPVIEQQIKGIGKELVKMVVEGKSIEEMMEKYSPGQARDDHGRFGSGGGAGGAMSPDTGGNMSGGGGGGGGVEAFADAAMAQSKMPKKIRDKVRQGIVDTLNNVPRDVVDEVQSRSTITVDLQKTFGEALVSLGVGSLASARGISGFCVKRDVGSVAKRGDVHVKISKDNPGVVSKNLAHEFAHSIDAGAKHSGTQEWSAAWKKELLPLKEYPLGDGDSYKAGALSDYARKSPGEGFAEFGRLMYSPGMRSDWDPIAMKRTPVSQDELGSKFPECYKFWKGKNLL